MGEKLISMLAAARLWGVAPKTVREWRLKGYLVRASDGRVDVKRSEAKLKQRPHRYRGGTCRGPLACRPVPLVCFDRCARRVRGIVIVS
jgi:hypothetical protein